jgi:hypothetical protein
MTINMYEYHSVKTPTVAKPKPVQKPPARAQAMIELIRAGYTPAEAMARLERADGHLNAMPVIVPENSGSATPKGMVKYPRRDVGRHNTGIMRKLTDKWMTGREMAAILKQEKVHVTYDLLALARDKRIEVRRSSAKAPYEFRRFQK